MKPKSRKLISLENQLAFAIVRLKHAYTIRQVNYWANRSLLLKKQINAANL